MSNLTKWLFGTDVWPWEDREFLERKQIFQHQRAGKNSISIQSGGSIGGSVTQAGDDIAVSNQRVGIKYDHQANAVYLTARPSRVRRPIAKTRTVNGDPLINIDYDADDRVVGIEVLLP